MITAYHFVGATLRDGRAIPPDGEWLIHYGPVVMCESGLHASRDPFDALQFAPGETLCVVECEDIAREDDEKLVCRRRRIVKRRDATAMLREFARAQALSVAHLWDCPPVVRGYLETGDESLSAAASDAVWDAARAASDAAIAARAASDAAIAARAASAAVRAAVWAAARAAAKDAASAAVWAAARAAAKDAASAAAWAAARAAAKDAASAAAWAAASAAASAAAWDAAWDAASDASRADFNRRVAELFA